MNLTVSGHHVEVTDALRQYVTEKLQQALRHFDHATSARVILSVVKLQHKAECNVHVKGKDFHAEAVAENLYAAIDAMADKLDRQLVKHKEIVTNHHHGDH